MDESAINKIGDMAATIGAKDLSQQHVPAVILPKNVEVKSIEHLQASPSHFVAHYETSVLEEFTEYCSMPMYEGSPVFIDPIKMAALALFDMGGAADPGWGNNTAQLTLNKTPEFAAVTEANGTTKKQLAFIDFCEDWADHITFYEDLDAQNSLEPAEAINRLRRMKVSAKKESGHETGDYSASRSAMESIEVASEQDPLPACFKFECVPYEGFTEQTITCRMRALTNGNELQLLYRIVGYEGLVNTVADEFRELISTQLEGKAEIRIGTMKYR